MDRPSDDHVAKTSAPLYVIGNHSDGVRHLIVSDGSQTGDIPHIAAAMAHDPLTDVVIVYTLDQKPAMDRMRATYGNATRFNQGADKRDPGASLYGGRIRTLLDKPGEEWRIKALTPKGIIGPPSEPSSDPDMYTYWRADGGRAAYKMMTVGGATSLVALKCRQLGPDLFFGRSKLCLGSGSLPCDSVIEFMKAEYNLDLSAGGRYLLIWSRYSGSKPNGYNPAGDSSVTGNKQLLGLADGLDRIPVTIGHDPPTGQTPRGTIHLGEFWANPAAGNPFAERGIPGQTSFYALFHDVCDVIQLGQKTGGMDNAALVGMRTVYIEDVLSPQQRRMKKWTGVLPGYRGAAVSRPPTPIGQSIRRLNQDLDNPDNRVATLASGKYYDRALANCYLYTEGYTEADLNLIQAEIRRLEPRKMG